MLIFSVVIFVFSTSNYVPPSPFAPKSGVMTPSSYGSAAPGYPLLNGTVYIADAD